MTDTIVETVDNRIPVNIVTGFLGSGKTTLLNHWVNTEEFKDTLVLINEFGDVGLDHELVQAVDDTVVLLGSGCICCTLQGELVTALAENLVKSKKGIIPSFNRVLIETTGLADPAGVIATLNGDELLMECFRYDGTITILDAQFIRQQIKAQYEAVKQIALADLILISKSDLVDADEIGAISDIAKEINSSAKIYPVVNGQISPKIIKEIGPYKQEEQKNTKKVENWLDFKSVNIASSIRPAKVTSELGVAKPKIIAHSNIKSFALEINDPIEPLALLAAINLVQQQYGDSILRIKGILNIQGQAKPVVVHGVQGNLYPLSELSQWPDDNKCSKLVFIVRETVLEQIKHLFTSSIENPDTATLDYYQSLIDNANLSGEN